MEALNLGVALALIPEYLIRQTIFLSHWMPALKGVLKLLKRIPNFRICKLHAH